MKPYSLSPIFFLVLFLNFGGFNPSPQLLPKANKTQPFSLCKKKEGLGFLQLSALFCLLHYFCFTLLLTLHRAASSEDLCGGPRHSFLTAGCNRLFVVLTWGFVGPGAWRLGEEFGQSLPSAFHTHSALALSLLHTHTHTHTLSHTPVRAPLRVSSFKMTGRWRKGCWNQLVGTVVARTPPTRCLCSLRFLRSLLPGEKTCKRASRGGAGGAGSGGGGGR